MVTFGLSQCRKENLIVMFSAANSLKSTKMKNMQKMYDNTPGDFCFKQKTWGENISEKCTASVIDFNQFSPVKLQYGYTYLPHPWMCSRPDWMELSAKPGESCPCPQQEGWK